MIVVLTGLLGPLSNNVTVDLELLEFGSKELVEGLPLLVGVDAVRPLSCDAPYVLLSPVGADAVASLSEEALELFVVGCAPIASLRHCGVYECLSGGVRW